MRPIRVLLIVAGAMCLPYLSGCVAVPIALGANMVHKSGAQRVALSGPAFPVDSFREAAIKLGGVVTATTTDYARAEFSSTAVKVELQKVKDGDYQLVGSSNTTVARSWEFTDNIGETTTKIAEHLASKGFTIVSNTRDRGL